MPLFSAAASTCCDTGSNWSNELVVLMANCTGKPCVPGQRRQLEGRDLLAGDAGDLLLDLGLQGGGASCGAGPMA